MKKLTVDLQTRLKILPPNFHSSVTAAAAVNIDMRTEGILFLEVFCVRSAVREKGTGNIYVCTSIRNVRSRRKVPGQKAIIL